MGVMNVRRAHALDALRGFAILMMVLSGLVPWGGLPRWMYHGYYLPTETGLTYAVIPGITWTDLVFPFFIFSMGAAFPLALSRRLDKGMSKLTITWASFQRWFLLIAFAIFNKHFSAYAMSGTPGKNHWALALVGFVLMFGIFGRFPWKMPKWAGTGIKTLSWIITAILFSQISYRGASFDLFRNNIILHVLASLALVGSIVWVTTSRQKGLRLGLLGFMLAINLSFRADGDNFIKVIGHTYEIPLWSSFIKGMLSEEGLEKWKCLYNFKWLFAWNYFKYMFVIIPATIIGDELNIWLRSKCTINDSWSPSRMIKIVLLMIGFMMTVLCPMYLREMTIATQKIDLVFASLILAFVGGLLGLKLTANPQSSTEKLLRNSYLFGIFWFILGILFDPLEGGIKKDPANFSYYFTTSGLAIFLLIAFTIIIDYFKKKKYLDLLVANGQNPMIAYVGNSNIILPILCLLNLTTLRGKINSYSAWLGLLVSICLTLIVALIVRTFTRFKIFLRT